MQGLEDQCAGICMVWKRKVPRARSRFIIVFLARIRLPGKARRHGGSPGQVNPLDGKKGFRADDRQVQR